MPREGYVEVEGGRVFFRVFGSGDGAPLLCLHGGPGFAHDYIEPLAAVGDGERPVIFYDQLGCGASDRPSNASLWRIDRFLDELDAVREHLGLAEVHLLGHSWGGCLAASYLLDGRSAPLSLILASPLLSVDRWLEDAGRLRSEMPEDVREVLDQHEKTGYTGCPEYTAATLQFYKRHLCRVDPWPDELERTWSAAGLHVYEAMWGPTEFYATGTLRGYDLSGRLAEIMVPTLFTCGQYDEAAPGTIAAFAERVRGAETIVFERSSHTPHLEERDAYAAAIGDFIARAEE